MGINRGAKIITDGLRVCADAASKRSQDGSTTTWTNLIPDVGHDGALENNAVLSDAKGGAIVLDGTNDYVDFGDISWVDTPADLTFSFAARITSDSADVDFISKSNHHQYSALIVWFDKSASSPSVGAGNTDCLSILTSNGSSSNRIWLSAPTNSIVIDTDYIIDCVLNPTNDRVSLYIDGALAVTDTNSNYVGINANSYSVRLGIAANDAKDMAGQFYYFRIYDRCLSADEIKQNYNATRGRFA